MHISRFILSVISLLSILISYSQFQTDENQVFEQTDSIYDSLIWSDDFDRNGSIDTVKWFPQTQLPAWGSWFGGLVNHYTDRKENAYQSNGILNLVAKRERFKDQGKKKNFTSVRLNSKFAFKYGRLEVRAKMPVGVGTWPAIWMLNTNITEKGAYWERKGYGTTPWPHCGEIDIMEHWGKNPKDIQSAVHTTSSHGDQVVNFGKMEVENLSTEFHTYALDWSSEKLVFSIDGVVHYTYAPEFKDQNTWPFDDYYYILMNIAIEKDIDSSFKESAMEVDYIRVYQ